MGEWVMSQLDARLGRGYSSVGSLNRLPAMPAQSEWDGTFNRRQNDIRSPARSAPLAAIGKAEIRRVVLVESDQYYREVQRWLGKFGQQDKWTFCLTTAQDAESRREYEQTIPPEP
jgi:hypothetical protein